MKRLFRKREAVDVEEALHTYGDMVYRLALVQMKNRSEAEDVFQEVFLRLVRYKDRIDGQEHLKPWLIRVTVNCCRKQFDSAYRRRTVPIDREIAEILELSEAAVKTRLSRARGKLKNTLKGEYASAGTV